MPPNITIGQHFAACVVAAVLVGYPLRRRIPEKGAAKTTTQITPSQRVYLAAIWFAFVGIPFCHRGRDELPLRTFSTMILVSLSCIAPLKLTELVAFPPPPKKPSTASGREATKNKKYGEAQQSSSLSILLDDFVWNFLFSFLFYGFPVSKKNKTISLKEFSQKAVEIAAWIPLKIVAAATLHVVMTELSSSTQSSAGAPLFDQDTASSYTTLLILFCMSILAISWIQDIHMMLVHVATLGWYEMLPLHEYVLGSTSLEDFWGSRYNRLMNHLLRNCAYIPAQNYFGYTKCSARYATFAISGVMHSLIAHFTFGYGELRSFLFFILQPVWMDLVTPRLADLRYPVGLTHTFFFLSSVMYVGLFVEALPDWFDLNPNQKTIPLVDEVLAPKVAQLVLRFLR